MAIMTFSDAREDRMLDLESQQAMRKLAMRMPSSMEGLFEVICSDDLPRRITGLRIAPDSAINEMRALMNELGIATRDVKHDGPMSPNYSLEEVITLLQAPPSAPPKRERVSYGDLVHVNGSPMTAPKYYAAQGIDYQGSYLLDTAGSLPELGHAEADMIKRIGDRIPASMHDAFTVDLTRQEDGSLIVQSLAVSPNVFQRVLGESFLAPLLEGGKPDGALGIRHHHRTLELDREQLQALHELLPANARQRA